MNASVTTTSVNTAAGRHRGTKDNNTSVWRLTSVTATSVNTAAGRHRGTKDNNTSVSRLTSVTATSVNTAAGRHRGTKDNNTSVSRLTSVSVPGTYLLMFVSIYVKEFRSNIIVNYYFFYNCFYKYQYLHY